MRITILAIGKAQRGPTEDLVAEYTRRCPWDIEVKEFDFKKPAKTADLRKAQEAERLLDAIPNNAIVITLDERGKALSSRSLASKIEAFQNEGLSEICFIIGGADGLDETVRKKARLTLAFGTLTWPHMLVRAMLAEQIYRVWTILNGHPYHRD